MKQLAFHGKRVTVMGLGRFGGGVGAVRYLVSQGARVTVTDLKDEDSLAESLSALQGLKVIYHLGGHFEEDFLDADMLVVSPAVNKKHSPLVRKAKRRHVHITSEMNLFLGACPAVICGVTGSIGKSTTTAMIHHVMERTHGYRKCHLGGNIGTSLLPELRSIGKRDLVVLELSSFMLADAQDLQWSPHVAVMTNIVANHLDRHGTIGEYVRVKKNIARFQTEKDFMILNRHLLKQSRWKGVGEATRVFYSLEDPLPKGKWKLRVPGLHNLENALAAYHACVALGAGDYEVIPHLNSFGGLPDRLENIAVINGVRYVNDSKATTPEAVVTGLQSFAGGRLIVIVGGSPKKVNYQRMARELVSRVRLCLVIGQTGPEIGQEIRSLPGGRKRLLHADSLERAVALAHQRARSGDVVLLSPGCASYDMFDNYHQRGLHFKKLVHSLK